MSSASRTGRQVGSYVICEQIGGGAMGRVWRGLDQALGRPVAIKMLRADLADRDGLIERFRTEARVLARLAHPNIAMIYALVEEEGDLYLVMEYVKGETLHSQLERSGALDLADCFPLFHHALDGIQHAHEAGVVHRDIKPSNLMLGAGGQVKWIDFGIAHVRGRERMTRAGGLVGTPEYMAPEQVRGEAGTIRSDVYALGVVLYKMLTGRPPFAGRGEFEVMRAQLETPPPRPSERGAAIGEALEDVLMKALAKDPAARFPSAMALQQALVEAGAPPPGPVPVLAGGPGLVNTAEETTLFDTGVCPPDHTLGAPRELATHVPATRELDVIADAETGPDDALRPDPTETRSMPPFAEDHVHTLQLHPDDAPEDVVVAEVLPAQEPELRPARRRSRPAHAPASWPRVALFVLLFATLTAWWITPPTDSVTPPAALDESGAHADGAAATAAAEPAPVEATATGAAQAAPETPAAATRPARRAERKPPPRRSEPPPPETRGWEIRR